MKISIRPEAAGDAAAIEAVTLAAFRNAPHTNHTEQFIVAALREAGVLTVSLVAVDGYAVIGHVAFSPVTVSDNAQGWFGLGPVSVLPDSQGKRIGTQLIEHGLGLLRKRGASGVVVLGDPRYYARFGFRAEPSLVLPDVPPLYFQALSFSGGLPSGTVAYHPAFGSTA
ncbi:MAG: GNAT family N-acetyltransferase [Lysobacterales bacterium RIFOXYD1_FULL_69_11]|nr:MAG: GNAT family N-acetyltransferase [Xanthomonadales bacterium RIFOXYA1_FULL_69_10]OHE88187.1 MAG: GNAT family N-acetyltransferase [Xanthomonadales bacterium RIFOXYD1_FULL_69_11]